MDKYFRPSLTDLNRHAFKVAAKRIAEDVSHHIVHTDIHRSSICGEVRDGQKDAARGADAGDGKNLTEGKNQAPEQELTDLRLPPRVRFFRAGESKPKD